MSFSAEWLTLREPYDHAARDAGLIASVAAFLPKAARITDLACGAGSTVAALAPAIGAATWLLVDYDPKLLAVASERVAAKVARVETRRADLLTELDAVLDTPIDGRAPDLVSTSAFLDLVSDAWLTHFVRAVAARRLPVYAALSYDGRATLDPVLPLDAGVVDALNRHQRTDKGFGPALGPTAADATVAAFRNAGYRVEEAQSDWVFRPVDRTIQHAMIDGWAGAAAEIGGLDADELSAWVTARRELVEAGRSTMTVGHVDVFARPM